MDQRIFPFKPPSLTGCERGAARSAEPDPGRAFGRWGYGLHELPEAPAARYASGFAACGSARTGGPPPPAAARGQHPENATGLEMDRALVRQALGVGLVAAGQEAVLAWSARLTTMEAPRTRSSTLGDQRYRDVLQRLQVSFDPVATTSPTGATAPVAERVAQDPQGIRPLKGLGRRVQRVRHVRMDSGLAMGRFRRLVSFGDRVGQLRGHRSRALVDARD